MTNIVDILSQVNGATFISIDTRTEPKMRKTVDTEDGRVSNPHYGRVTKTQTGSSIMVFQNKRINGYEAMVQRRLVAEGKSPESFELSERKWGSRIPNLPLVEHNGQYYLEVIFLTAGQVEYLLDGKLVDRKDIQGLSESAPAEQGGLEDKVTIRTFKLSNVSTIRINHESYSDFVCEVK